MTTEQDLLQACQRNDRKAQSAFYNLYKCKMLGVCRRYARSVSEAEDILQDAFIKVFTKIHSVHKNESIGGWVRNIVINTAIDHYRKHIIQSNQVGYDDALGVSDEFQISAISHLSLDEILNVIQQLPDGYRMIINLYLIDGFSHSEIAKILNISEGTSKSQLSRAKGILKNKLKTMGIVA